MCTRSSSVPRSISAGSMSAVKSPRRKPEFPGSLTDLHRYRKTVHGHDGDSRIVMVRKTDERTFASIVNGQEPHLETITRETVETFRGQRTELKVTTERKEKNAKVPPDLLEILSDHVEKSAKNGINRKKSPTMDFQIECLKAHNDYRAKHSVPPLRLSSKICKASQEWANYLLKRNTLEHSKNAEYGENIFFMSSSDPDFTISGKEPVNNWYEEIERYNFGVEPKSLNAGHFTQVIWKESRELGVGMAQKNGRIYVVANYFPPGNIIGHFAQNVLPPGVLKNEANSNEAVERSFSRLDIYEKVRRSTPTRTRSVSINGTEGNFDEDFLRAHNEYRARHGVPPLKLDKKICKYAEEWAKILATKNILEHRKNCPYGENIYAMYSSDPNFRITGHTPVDVWYEEVRHYPFGREPNNLKSGHFTQVIWKASESLGVGVAKSRSGYIYVVANYSPAGNFVGSFAENVPPPISAVNGKVEIKSPSPVRNVLEHRASMNGEGEFTQFQVDILKIHNEYRRKHGVPELVLSKQLCEFAQEWADRCIKTGNMAPRPNNPYGENLFAVYSSDFSHVPSARDAVKEWYDEIKEHVFGKESFNYASLHFCQIVWKSTKELGVGIGRNQKGQTIVVANYNPRGNVFGQFNENIQKPRV